MKVKFTALIKEIKTKSLVSGDKSTRMILEFDNPADELLDKINRLHKADSLISVILGKEG